MSDLYRSDNLVVRSVPAEDQTRWVVTFDNYGIGHGFDRPGFGEAFLEAAGVSAIHVMGRREDWYQYPDMEAAMAAVRQAVAGAERVMTYGSSMGGYAAIRFADAANANAALAISPQYSIDPVKAPFERRWSQDSNRIHWLDEIDGPIRCRIRPIVVYDPSMADDRHVSMIQGDIPIAAIKLHHVDHPATSVLAEANLLSSLVLDALSGALDVEAFSRLSRARRRDSATYLATLAERQPAWRLQTGLSLARQALEKNPHNVIAMTVLAGLLNTAGEHDESMRLLEHAYLLTNGDNLHAAHHYAKALTTSGRAAEALVIARKAVAEAPHMAHLYAWESSLLWATSAHDEAITAIRRAMALDPRRRQYRNILRRYLRDIDEHRGTRPPVHRTLIRLLKKVGRFLSPSDEAADASRPSLNDDAHRGRRKA